MEIETYEDGWDCEPKLKSAMESIEKCDHFKYEIDNCVRESELDYMVYEMIDFFNHNLYYHYLRCKYTNPFLLLQIFMQISSSFLLLFLPIFHMGDYHICNPFYNIFSSMIQIVRNEYIHE